MNLSPGTTVQVIALPKSPVSNIFLARGEPGPPATDVTTAEYVSNSVSATRAVLSSFYADKSTQAAVENGRLNDEVLSQRFEQTKLFIPATQFALASGAPALSALGGTWPIWRLDAAAIEGVSCVFVTPPSWAKFDVIVRGVNIGPGTGDVVLRVLHNARVDGEDITTGTTVGADTHLTAGAPNLRQSVSTRTNMTADSTKSNIIRVQRQASDATDTLTNDYGITGIELVATSFVTFAPPALEAVVLEPTGPVSNCFTKASNNTLAGLKVWQQSPPPANDTVDATYPYWPVTDSSTAQNFNTSTWTGGRRWSFHWANRCNYGAAWNKKPNPLPAPTVMVDTRQARSVFTTVDRANAATQCQIRYMCGNDEATYQAPWLAVGGVSGDFITDAAFRANPATYCTTDWTTASATYKVMTDKVLLPAPRFVDGSRPDLQPGVVLDYEVQDSRTSAQTQTFLTALGADCHAAGKKLFVYSNPLNAPTQQWTSLDSTNMPAIMDAVDYVGIMLWSGNREGSISKSWTAQLAMLGTMDAADWDKLVIVYELGNPGTTLADAQWVHDKLHESGNHPTNVMFWRDYAVQGGACSTPTNQKITTIITP